MEFLITKFDKGENRIGLEIGKKERICGPYPWHKGCETHKFRDYNIRFYLLFWEISWSWFLESK